MKNTKRIVALLLSGILLASSFVSCNKNGTGKNGDSDMKRGEAGEFVVPEGILEGETFSMYIAFPTAKDSYLIEEETGDEIKDVVYQRNQKVEEHLGVTLEFGITKGTTNGSDQAAETDRIRLLIMGGDQTYDAYVHCQHETPTLIQEKLLVDWNNIPYINVESPWWYSNVARDITYGGKIYAMTGDYNLTSFSTTECLIFNKNLCDELGLEYPYDMVFEGTWTHDAFLEYVQAATKDLNGDGKMKTADDRYGYGCWGYEGIPAFYVAYGAQTIVKDDNNMPVLNIENEHIYNVIDAMIDVFRYPGAFWETQTYGVDDRMFEEGRLLFNDSFILHIPATRSYEDFEVGFVPYPKYDEEQEEYYSRSGGISELTLIPITNLDLEKTGAVLETMAYYSNQMIMPAYFDTLLTIKSTRDTESEDMIPIIRNSSRFNDAVIAFDGYSIIRANQGNTLSSLIATNKGAWQDKVNDLIELYTVSDAAEEVTAE